MKLYAVMMSLSGCTLLPWATNGPVCYEAPAEFMGDLLTDCYKDTNGATCCGYGYLSRGHNGPLCFHIICQQAPCNEWMFHATHCYEQEATSED